MPSPSLARDRGSAAASLAAGPEACSAVRVRVADPDVVFFRSVLEAYDGLVQWSGDGSGVLTLIVPRTQREALDELLAALAAEVSLEVLPDALF